MAAKKRLVRPRAPALAAFVEPLRQPLALQGEVTGAAAHAAVASVGFFDPVHPATIQVIGDAGRSYLEKQNAAARAALAGRLARKGLALTIATEGADPSPWEALTSDRPAHEIVFALRRALAEAQTERRDLHGVLVEVYGAGALLVGAPGSGKGSLALELLNRGHRLVADDAVELLRPASGILLGRGNEVLEGYLEVRDLGVLDVKKMHGLRAVTPQCRVDLVIELVKGRNRTPTVSQLLGGRRATRRILGVPLPVLSLPARSRHNLAPLVEAACLDQRLRDAGVDAVAALVRRQARAIQKSR